LPAVILIEDDENIGPWSTRRRQAPVQNRSAASAKLKNELLVRVRGLGKVTRSRAH
jgi:hypothetical protein